MSIQTAHAHQFRIVLYKEASLPLGSRFERHSDRTRGRKGSSLVNMIHGVYQKKEMKYVPINSFNK